MAKFMDISDFTEFTANNGRRYHKVDLDDPSLEIHDCGTTYNALDIAADEFVHFCPTDEVD